MSTADQCSPALLPPDCITHLSKLCVKCIQIIGRGAISASSAKSVSTVIGHDVYDNSCLDASQVASTPNVNAKVSDSAENTDELKSSGKFVDEEVTTSSFQVTCKLCGNWLLNRVHYHAACHLHAFQGRSKEDVDLDLFATSFVSQYQQSVNKIMRTLRVAILSKSNASSGSVAENDIDCSSFEHAFMNQSSWEIKDLRNAVRELIKEQLVAAWPFSFAKESSLRIRVIFESKRTQSQSLLKPSRRRNGEHTWGNEGRFVKGDDWRLKMDMVKEPVHFRGLYFKDCRDMSQTAWLVRGAHARSPAAGSVEECLHKLLLDNGLLFQNMQLMGSGREDADVRMLGSGRPFVVDIVDCLNPADLNSCLRSVEAGCGKDDPVWFRNLQVCNRDGRDELNKAVGTYCKTYRCVCWSDKAVSKNSLEQVCLLLSGKTIVQQTPIRVLHRRVRDSRRRTIHKVEIEPVNRFWFTATIQADGGTYIKELVHGDRGRTVPSFKEALGCDCDIAQLDVLGVGEEQEYNTCTPQV